MSLLLQASVPVPPPVDAPSKALYDFDCTAKSDRGERIVLSGKLAGAVDRSLIVHVADFELAGATSARVAGAYGAGMIGDVIVLDNLPRFVTGKASAANRIIVDRTVLGPGTVMVKSTRKSEPTITYFGYCAPRKDLDKK